MPLKVSDFEKYKSDEEILAAFRSNAALAKEIDNVPT